MQLINADCLEAMNDLDDDSIDMVFTDLPYGQTSCAWDKCLDLEKFWKLLNKKCKKECPMIFTCSTKFGVDLINSNKKNFRYDLVWIKSRNCNFLNAKKMPMKRHEMVYVFYRKIPKVYTENISKYHTHKFMKGSNKSGDGNSVYGAYESVQNKKYEPPLPVSVVNEEDQKNNDEYELVELNNSEIYGENLKVGKIRDRKDRKNVYDPPLPVSVVKEEEPKKKKGRKKHIGVGCYVSENRKTPLKSMTHSGYEPPLPVSVLNKDNEILDAETKEMYEEESNNIYNNQKVHRFKGEKGSRYDPPLPFSVVKEDSVYGEHKSIDYPQRKNGESAYEPPLPVSIVNKNNTNINSEVYGSIGDNGYTSQQRKGKVYDPPLPTSNLEIKSECGKHSTQKPVALMEWLLKYYSKEGDLVLDATMGSGSTGVACKNMNREFIGIELNKDIYDSACLRLGFVKEVVKV